MRFQKSFVKLNTKKSIQLAELDPKAMLIGDNPRLIDEWQNAPRLLDAVRREVDNRGKRGQRAFIQDLADLPI